MLVSGVIRIISKMFLMSLVLLSCKKEPGVKPEPVIPPDDIVETAPSQLIPVTHAFNEAIGGFYAALPAHYEQTTKSYPVLIFLHGLGQRGNGNSDLVYLLNDGIGKLLSNKKFPPNFIVNQKNYSFIVIIPQFSKRPDVSEMGSLITYIKSEYRVDISRIYLSGLSLGANITTEIAAEYPSLFAALCPMSGVETFGDEEKRCEKIAKSNLPVWVFHNIDDPMVPVYNSEYFVELINRFKPAVPARITIFPFYGHDSWTMALDPTFKENDLNIYEWMLQYSR